MAFVRYGWILDGIRDRESAWIEPASCSVSVSPIISNCALEIESIAHTPPHYSSITDKLNRVVDNLKNKGVTVNSQRTLGAGPTQATLTTPFSIKMNCESTTC